MFRWRIGFALLMVSSLFALGGCGSGGSSSSTTTTPATTTGRLAVTNAVPDAISVDVYVDSSKTPALAGIPYTSMSSYIPLTAGAHTITLVVNTSGSVTTSSHTVTHSVNGSGGDQTLLALGEVAASSLTTALLTDNNTATPTGTARLRIVDAAPNAGSVDVYVTAAGADISSPALKPTFANVTYNPSAYNSGQLIYFSVVSGLREVRFTKPGTKTLLADTSALTINNQQSSTVYLFGDPGIGKGYAAVLPGTLETSRVRVVNYDALDNLDVYLSNSQLATNIGYMGASAYVPVPSGSAFVTVDQYNTTNSLIQGSENLLPGTDYSFFTFSGPPSSSSQTAVTNVFAQDNNDTATIPAGEARVRFVDAGFETNSTRFGSALLNTPLIISGVNLSYTASFGTVGPYVYVPTSFTLTGIYTGLAPIPTVSGIATQQTQSSEVLTTFGPQAINLTAGHTYTIVLRGTVPITTMTQNVNIGTATMPVQMTFIYDLQPPAGVFDVILDQ